ncbi:MAG TPA: DegT/DnrJ/EryC1/StrS aminotransferase family protein, partial [Thermoanaerobaculia bacterium]
MAVDFYRHSLGEEEKAAVAAVLDSLFLTTGQTVYDFEKAFEQFLGVPAVVATVHCTASLHLAMLAAGVGPGDEVITTPMTFLSSANAVVYAGGTPVFVDAEADTANIDAARVEAAITPRTKAIVAVDLYGLPADLVALRAIADRHALALVEDAAHCVEGRRNGYGPGQLADYGCFSFYATKNLTCGEGGAISVRDASKKPLLRQLGTHGMSKNAADRYAGKYEHWDMDRLGWKYNMSNVVAALLTPQLPKLETRLVRREEICLRYEAAFREMPGVSFPVVSAGATSGRHLFT